MVEREPARKRPGATARLVGTVVFGVVVATLTTVFSVQIIVEAWSDSHSVESDPCRESLSALFGSLNRARQSAAKQSGELEALAAFRSELSSAWGGRSSLKRACAGDPRASRMLVDLFTLRYAEEHAVRYEAREIADQRRNVQAMAEALFSQPQDATP